MSGRRWRAPLTALGAAASPRGLGAEAALPPHLERRGGVLHVGGVDARELAARGTPVHVLDLPALRRRVQAVQATFRRRLGPDVRLRFPYKTQGLASTLRVLATAGVGAEVISEGELQHALALLPPERIAVSGVAPGPPLLERARHAGVRVHVSSAEGLERVGEAAAISVRVRPRGGWGGFGVPLEQAPAALRRASELAPRVGLHVHVGTNLRSPRRLVRALGELGELRRRSGVELDELNVGGGFATPGVRDLGRLDRVLAHDLGLPPPPRWGPAPDLDGWLRRLAEACAPFDDLARAAEPGRLLTSDSQLLLLTVLDVRGDTAVVDGGQASAAAPLRFERHRVLLVDREGAPRTQRLVGRLPTPGDVLAPAARLPPLRPGDTLAVLDTGAYFGALQTSWSFPSPGVLALDDGVTWARRPGEPALP